MLFFLSSISFKDPEWKYIATIPTSPIHKFSTDPYNFFYISDEKGNVTKYAPDGKVVVVYSPRKNSPITLLEGWRNVNIFLFYRNFQEYKILDRFMTERSSSRFDPKQIGFARLATLSADNNLWVVDDRDFSLKKLNLTFNKIEISNSLELIVPELEYDLTYMREYNNNLFIADANSGILVLDNLGNLKTSIPALGVTHFSFLENSIYFLSTEGLIVINLQTGEKKVFPTPQKEIFQGVILDKAQGFFFSKSGIYIFSHSLNIF